jgi:hypothetical protein
MNHLRNVVFIVGVAIIFLLVVMYVEEPLLDSQISVGPGVTLESWLAEFRFWATIGIALEVIAVFVWYLLCQLKFKVNRWPASDKRPVWSLIFLISLIVSVALCYLLTPPAQEGRILALVFYLLNNLLLFWAATLLASPSSFKHTPYLAEKLRYW